jgi:cytochrome c-type biogenesis protein CcmH
VSPAGRVLSALVLALALAAPVAAQQPAAPVAIDEKEVYEIASQLRCVVCQNLSVADSPSEMAQQMRTLVRERLATGANREQVIQYFVDRYGEWILLAPKRSGFTLLVWIFPFVAVAIGLAVVAVVVRGWKRTAATTPAARPVVDTEMRERIRRAVDAEDT